MRTPRQVRQTAAGRPRQVQPPARARGGRTATRVGGRLDGRLGYVTIGTPLVGRKDWFPGTVYVRLSVAGFTTDSWIFVPLLLAAQDQPCPTYLFQRPAHWGTIVQHYQGVLHNINIQFNSVGANTGRDPGGLGLPYNIASKNQEFLIYLGPNAANHVAAWITRVRAAGPYDLIPVLPFSTTYFTVVIPDVDIWWV